MTRSPILRTLLQPLGLLYALATRVRAKLYQAGLLRSRRLPGIVISVGNLTVGGTGKTPMVLWIAERLSAEGNRPAILTRGYGGFGQGGAALRGARMPMKSLCCAKGSMAAPSLGLAKIAIRTGSPWPKMAQNGSFWMTAYSTSSFTATRILFCSIPPTLLAADSCRPDARVSRVRRWLGRTSW